MGTGGASGGKQQRSSSGRKERGGQKHSKHKHAKHKRHKKKHRRQDNNNSSSSSDDDSSGAGTALSQLERERGAVQAARYLLSAQQGIRNSFREVRGAARDRLGVRRSTAEVLSARPPLT
jgi:hypothetical protein